MPVVAQKRKSIVAEPIKAPAVEEDKIQKRKKGKAAEDPAIEPAIAEEPAMEDKENKKRKREKVTDNSADVKEKDEPMQEDKEAKVEEAECPQAKIAKEEEETTKARTKELKALHVDQLRELVSSKGLELGKKENMVEAVVAQEAKARADVREHEARIRAVMVKKKDELEAFSAQELKDLCTAKGITGALAKPARMELLLKQWQEEDGVNKAIAKIVRDARQEEFEAMDKPTLQKFCAQAGVDPFVKEVIVDRVLRYEVGSGRFGRPVVAAVEKEIEVAPKNEPVDIVDALLAGEAARKKEFEAKRQQEQAEADKKNELKAMTVEALKKLLVSKGKPIEGKKDDMVEVLFDVHLQEEAMTAKKNKLKSLSVDALNKLLLNRGLVLGKKDEMVDSILAYEDRTREAASVYAKKFQEVMEKVKADFESKTNAELKELCINQGLKAGVGAEERVERLLEAAKEKGEIDKMLATVSRQERRQELIAMPNESLVKLCHESSTDPLVKEVMVERMLAHESEFGRIEFDSEPKSKKARV